LNREDRRKKREYLKTYKINKGCSVCGYNEIPEALEFDHVDRTQKRIKMSRAHHYSWRYIMEEMEKCVVLCANCHRKKTTEEKDYLEIGAQESEEEEVRQYDLFGELT